MSNTGHQTLLREGVDTDRISLRGALDLRYVGQWHELTLAVELPIDLNASALAFHVEHDRLFGHSSPDAEVEVLAVRVSAIGETRKPALTAIDETTAGEAAALATRPVWSPAARALVDTPVHDGQSLRPRAMVGGPAIVELSNTTIVVPEAFTLDVDAYGAFAVHTGERGAAFATRLDGTLSGATS
jgi:N-methylhydantoinase A